MRAVTYNGAALSPRAFVSFETSDATTITTAIKPIEKAAGVVVGGAKGGHAAK